MLQTETNPIVPVDRTETQAWREAGETAGALDIGPTQTQTFARMRIVREVGQSIPQQERDHA
jgi:hypothetical protein